MVEGMTDAAFVALVSAISGLAASVLTYALGVRRVNAEMHAVARTAESNARAAAIADQAAFRADLMKEVSELRGQLTQCLTECAQCRADNIEAKYEKQRADARIDALEAELHRRRVSDREEPVMPPSPP